MKDAGTAKNVAREIEEIVDHLTLMDDDLMALVFDHNIEAANLLLRIILEREDLEVVEVIGQKELENPIVEGRNIKLDILAKDSAGKFYNIEVQRDRKGAHIRRARFHSSMLDTRMLKEGQNFSEMRDSYVIFITQKDQFREGLPLYHISRVIEETGGKVHDGSHIIYVNGAYKEKDALGRLMHDFSCKDADDMHYAALKKSVRHFKKEGGREIVCKAVEEYGEACARLAKEEGRAEGREEGREETKVKIVLRMLNSGKYSDEEIAVLTDVKVGEVRALKEA